MLPGSQALLDLINGGRVPKPPFWEVWFTMWEFCRRNYGDYWEVENRIAMAKDLGMAAVQLGFLDLGIAFGNSSVASDGTSHYAGGTLRSWSQIEECRLPVWTDEFIRKHQADREKIRDAGLASWLSLPWCFHQIATCMGLEEFAVRCYDDFDFVKAAFAWVEDRNRTAIRQLFAEIRPDFMLFDGDCAYKNGLMVNPAMFRELVCDETQKTVSELKKLGIPYTFHSDGKMNDFVPVLIELGFSAVHGCEKAANDLEEVVEKFGDDICLIGNMDVVFLSRATVEEVRAETEAMLAMGSQKQRFIAACNTSPQDYIPEENYRAMADVIKNS